MKRETGKKNILVLRYRFIGDTILTVPFLRNLRRAEPDAYIAWVVAPGTADVVKGIPYVDELIYWDPVTIHADSRGTHRTLSSKLAYIRDLRARKFDKVYVLKRSLSSAIMAFLSGARERIGFDSEGRGLLLTKSVPYVDERHEVLNFLEVLRADGVQVDDDHLEAWLSEDEQGFAQEMLRKAGVAPGAPVVAIHPFTANPKRAWHLANYIEVANQIQREYGVRVLILGGVRDREEGAVLAEKIVPAPIMAIGSTNLRQSMALLANCRFLICNDSGIMHLGAALGTPLIALFGPQSPVKFGPWGKKARVLYAQFPCSPCRQKFFKECEPSYRQSLLCMEAITPAQVLDLFKVEYQKVTGP